MLQKETGLYCCTSSRGLLVSGTLMAQEKKKGTEGVFLLGNLSLSFADETVWVVKAHLLIFC